MQTSLPHKHILNLLRDTELESKLNKRLTDYDMRIVRMSMMVYKQWLSDRLGYLPESDTRDSAVEKVLLQLFPLEIVYHILECGGLITDKDKAQATMKVAFEYVHNIMPGCSCFLEYANSMNLAARTVNCTINWTLSDDESESFVDFCENMFYEIRSCCRRTLESGELNLILLWSFFTCWDCDIPLVDATEMFDYSTVEEIKNDLFYRFVNQ